MANCLINTRMLSGMTLLKLLRAKINMDLFFRLMMRSDLDLDSEKESCFKRMTGA